MSTVPVTPSVGESKGGALALIGTPLPGGPSVPTKHSAAAMLLLPVAVSSASAVRTTVVVPSGIDGEPDPSTRRLPTEGGVVSPTGALTPAVADGLGELVSIADVFGTSSETFMPK